MESAEETLLQSMRETPSSETHFSRLASGDAVTRCDGVTRQGKWVAGGDTQVHHCSGALAGFPLKRSRGGRVPYPASRPTAMVCVLGLLILLLTAGPAGALQKIYLNNGSSLTGEILREESNTDFTVVDLQTGKTSIPTSSILQVVELQSHVGFLHQAEALKQQKHYIKAALLYQRALDETTDASVRKQCREEIDAIALVLLNTLKEGNPNHFSLSQCCFVARLTGNSSLIDQMERLSESILYEDLRRWLSEGKQALRQEDYPVALGYFDQILSNATASPQFLQAARHEKAKVFIDQAAPYYRSQVEAERLQAERLLLQALDVQPDNDRANFMLGSVYVKMQHSPKTLEHFQKVRDSKILTEQERRFVRRHIDRILAKREQREKLQLAAQDGQRRAGREGEQGILDRLMLKVEEITGGRISMDNSGAYLQQVKILAPFVVPVVAVFLGWFYIPLRITRWHCGKQPELKRDYVRLTKYTGAVGLLIYIFSLITTEKSKIRCPHCKKALDSPAMFEDYNFSRCPFCRKTIKAPYKMQDYLQALAGSIVRERAAMDDRKGRDWGALVGRDSTLKLLRALITYAIRLRSSDIHIEAEDAGDLLFRFRIDGVLHDGVRMPITLHSLVITAVKNLAELDIAERRIPQDGHFSLLIDSGELNIRVATTPTRTGEKAVMRLLVPRESIFQLTELGFSPKELGNYERAIMSPHGIILSTGPTGSGKSTTLYSSLTVLADGQKSIVTIEDPIEYEIAGVNQIQVNPKAGLNFSNALRSILRQDPDVIMVGEIRDRDTAEIAASAALTGHLVLATLHTIDSCTALSRLIDLGVDPKQLASAVVAIVAQRLVRIVCPKCKKAYRPREEDLRKLGLKPSSIPENVRFYHGRGCPKCQDTGYLGRTGLFEILMVQGGGGHVQKTLELGAGTAGIREAARLDRMRTLREAGIDKVLRGITTVAEVLRVTREETFLQDTGPPAGSEAKTL